MEQSRVETRELSLVVDQSRSLIELWLVVEEPIPVAKENQPCAAAGDEWMEADPWIHANPK